MMGMVIVLGICLIVGYRWMMTAITGLGEGFVGYRAIVSASCAVVLKTHPCSLIWFVYDLGSVNNLVEAGEVPTVSVRRIEFALGCQLMPGFYTKFLSSIPWEVCLTLWRLENRDLYFINTRKRKRKFSANFALDIDKPEKGWSLMVAKTKSLPALTDKSTDRSRRIYKAQPSDRHCHITASIYYTVALGSLPLPPLCNKAPRKKVAIHELAERKLNQYVDDLKSCNVKSIMRYEPAQRVLSKTGQVSDYYYVFEEYIKLNQELLLSSLSYTPKVNGGLSWNRHLAIKDVVLKYWQMGFLKADNDSMKCDYKLIHPMTSRFQVAMTTQCHQTWSILCGVFRSSKVEMKIKVK